jgi:hypothetical protein
MGIIKVKAIYSKSTINITYDKNMVELDVFIEAIEKLDYSIVNKRNHPDKSAVNVPRVWLMSK